MLHEVRCTRCIACEMRGPLTAPPKTGNSVMGPLIGIPLLIIAVIGGYMGMGGEISVLWQPFEMLIVAGAAVSTLIFGHPPSVLKDSSEDHTSEPQPHHGLEEDYLELLSLLYAILRSVKGQGMLQLESMIERPHESELFQQYPRVLANPRAVNFLCDYLRLLSLGTAAAA